MKKIFIIIISLVICLSLVGCDINFSSVDILMRPPKLSGKNSLLQQTFESTVENKENVVMKTPLSGDNRSSYLLYDIDNDSVSEALVLYSDHSKDSLAYISVFKFLNGKWSFVSTIKGRSEEIYSVDFADINGDNNLEILISWASSLQPDSYISVGVGGISDKNLAIYSYNGSSITLLKNEVYTKLFLEDIDNDKSIELFILNIGLSNKEKVTEARVLGFDKENSIVQDVTISLTGMLDVYNMVCDSYVFNDETHTRVYIDGSISETGIITEIVDINHNTSEITLPLYESNTSVQPITLRNVRTYSQDFDNDGFVEIPTLEKLFGGVQISTGTELKQSINLTVWSEFINNEFVVDDKCLLNVTYDYMLQFPDSWVGNITAVYSEDSSVITFYSVDLSETLLVPLFSIRANFENDWDNDDNNYVKFEENGIIIYGYQIFDEENQSEYIEFIEESFISIKQE